jgi:hypothetical protein
MPQVATQTYRTTMASDRVVTTSSIRIHSVILAYDSAGANTMTVFFKTADGSATYFALSAGTGSSMEFHDTWVCDKGLSLVSTVQAVAPPTKASAIVTVLYSSEGA